MTIDMVAMRKKAERLLYAGLIAICGALLLAVLFLLDRGIDLTDEGAYLNAIATPGLYPNSLTLFGFFYHPLMVAFAYNIWALRIINCAILVVLTLALTVRATNAIGFVRSLDSLARIGLWTGFTASALFFYCIWLPTPSYNSLNVSGALLFCYAAVGIMVSDQFSVRDAIIAGVALATCALTKPTSGAALALLLLGFSLGAGPAYIWSVVAAGLISALLFCTFLLFLHGSPSAAFAAFHDSMSFANGLLKDKSTFDVYLASSIPNSFEFFYIFFVCVIAATILLVTEFRAKLGPWAVPSHLAAFAALLALCIWMRFHVDSWNRPLHWTPALFALVFALGNVMRTRRIQVRQMRVAIFLLVVPVAIGVGSNTGMLRSAGQAAAIWSVASLFILAAMLDSGRLQAYAKLTAISSVIAAAIVVVWAVYFPQRQVAPLWQQHTWISAHGRDHALRVDPVTAAYFRELGSRARENGFSDATDVIDLTGNAAVTIYVLGGNALGAAYFSGGNSWTNLMVEHYLRPVPYPRLERAWIITRVKASDTIDPAVLRKLGLNFPRDYEPVAHATPAAAAGEQTLWKPKSAP